MRYLLEGSVRRAGHRLRITAKLIDATNDEHLWADTYEGTVDDVFAIQERLARVIVDALELRLTANEEQRFAERAIDNLPAYECYLRARHEAWRWRKDSIDHAVQLLREALAIIGDNVRLYAALGMAHLQYREAGIDFSERPLVEAEMLRIEIDRAEAGLGLWPAAAGLDSLLARPSSGSGARSQGGARNGAEQCGYATPAEQLLPDLGPSVVRTAASDARCWRSIR